MEEEDQIDHQEMEREKVLVLKGRKVSSKKMIQESLALETNQVHLEEEDQIDHQEMEREKVLVLKGRKDKSKPTGYTNNPKYFGKKPLEDFFKRQSLVLKVEKNLKKMTSKVLLLKNITEKELKSKTF